MSEAARPYPYSEGENAIPDEYYFITAPQNVTWQKNSKSSEIATYGTNSPYLTYGSTSLRKLKLGNAMVEGFSDGKEIETNITDLEECMEMIVDTNSGYVSPYCWHVYAGDKSYGIYIIKSVSVDETMRDMSGKATRAFVDVELQEVSPQQVTSGTDLTSEPIVGGITQEAYDALNPQTQVNSQEAAVGGTRSGAVTNSTGQTPAQANGTAPLSSSTVRPDPTGRYSTRYEAETGREAFQ